MTTNIYIEEVGRVDYPLDDVPDTESWSEEHRQAIETHHAAFGQRGQTPDHRVQPHEWQHSPFVQPVTTPWRVPLAPDHLPILLLGFVPIANRSWNNETAFRQGETIMSHIIMSSSRLQDRQANEDKWFIYADGPDGAGEMHLHMYHSWSGHKLVELCIDAGPEGYGYAGTGASITAITWESAEGWRWNDASAGLYMAVARKVCSWVLNVDLGPASDGTEDGLDVENGGVPRWIEPTVATMVAVMKNRPSEPGLVHRAN
ncbi:hypothetical protein GQ53DRAFT_880660 [Thozetella sp. PMI_491]|nr:hypothetical protein GQ53DRAFT_880660 [Thozetella sp. PMI_491]